MFPIHLCWDTLWSSCRGCHGNNTSQRCDTSTAQWIYMTRHHTMVMFITWEHPDHTIAAQPSASNAAPALVWMQPVSKLYTSGQLSPCLCLEIFSLWRAEEPKEPLTDSLSNRPRLAGKAQPRSTDGMCLTPCFRAELFHKCLTFDPACSRLRSGPNANIISREMSFLRLPLFQQTGSFLSSDCGFTSSRSATINLQNV